MKLNKNGWGFLEFFAFLLIFVVCLVFSAWGLRKLGLLDENWNFVDFSEIGNNKNNVDTFSYSDLESKMTEATKGYIKDFYNNELGLDTLNIKVSQLISNNYLDKLKDGNGKDCSGYVSVYLDQNNNIQYDPYLKCKKYETNGYEERKDTK